VPWLGAGEPFSVRVAGAAEVGDALAAEEGQVALHAGGGQPGDALEEGQGAGALGACGFGDGDGVHVPCIGSVPSP
jgi:hypothetical protein